MWMRSPPHRANMMRGGCQAVASAMSANGRRYWAMEIGNAGGGGVVARQRSATFLSSAAKRRNAAVPRREPFSRANEVAD
jgi:hypothetical protein